MKSRSLNLLLVSLLFFNGKPSGKAPCTTAASPAVAPSDSCWAGYLAGKTPVFMHYRQDGEVLVGEITYLNTKNKAPIRLLGTIEEDKTYRLLEFDKTGTITGIIKGLPAGNGFTGHWFSPGTSKTLALQLAKKDTLIASTPIRADGTHLFGSYGYRYGAAGGQGDFTLTKLAAGKASFKIAAATARPAYNLAEVPLDTVTLAGTSFTYAVPGTEKCAFKVQFYKDFAFIKYTIGTGNCAGWFGHNATVEGLFLKRK